MLLPVLAGLGALSLMSNPRRRRRRTTRRNPEFQFAVEHTKTGRQRVSPWFPSREEGERWLARLNRDDGAGTWRRLGRATRRGRMGGGRLDREIHGESLNLRAAASYGNRAEMGEAQDRLDRLSKARRMMKRRTNPGRPVAKPTTERRAYQLGYAEGRDATGDLGRRGGWPAPEDISPSRGSDRFAIAWLRGNDAGLAAMRRSRSNPRRRRNPGERVTVTRVGLRSIGSNKSILTGETASVVEALRPMKRGGWKPIKFSAIGDDDRVLLRTDDGREFWAYGAYFTRSNPRRSSRRK